LHHGFNFARNLDEEFFPNSPWLSMLVRNFEQVLAGFSVDPFSDCFKQAHRW
jgi:hypothetical protein